MSFVEDSVEFNFLSGKDSCVRKKKRGLWRLKGTRQILEDGCRNACQLLLCCGRIWQGGEPQHVLPNEGLLRPALGTGLRFHGARGHSGICRL